MESTADVPPEPPVEMDEWTRTARTAFRLMGLAVVAVAIAFYLWWPAFVAAFAFSFLAIAFAAKLKRLARADGSRSDS